MTRNSDIPGTAGQFVDRETNLIVASLYRREEEWRKEDAGKGDEVKQLRDVDRRDMVLLVACGRALSLASAEKIQTTDLVRCRRST